MSLFAAFAQFFRSDPEAAALKAARRELRSVLIRRDHQAATTEEVIKARAVVNALEERAKR